MVKFEAQDTVLNNFDFSARSQQKDGITDDSLSIKVGMDLLLISDDGVRGEICELIEFVSLDPQQKDEIVKSVGAGTTMIEDCVQTWLTKHPWIPKVRVQATGQVKLVPCRLWTIQVGGKATAWRIHLPLRLGYAISVNQAVGLTLEAIQVPLTDLDFWYVQVGPRTIVSSTLLG